MSVRSHVTRKAVIIWSVAFFIVAIVLLLDRFSLGSSSAPLDAPTPRVTGCHGTECSGSVPTPTPTPTSTLRSPHGCYPPECRIVK